MNKQTALAAIHDVQARLDRARLTTIEKWDDAAEREVNRCLVDSIGTLQSLIFREYASREG